ncbi:MAG TPA: ketopantoate reductase family protein [Blastocatellia bacterium]|nr:ketopantoate reductase family protein [Blastocatellia bacterium]
MRYIIHGAGAIGSLVGGWLAASGAEVVMVARQAHAEAINERGLTIRSREGDRHITGITAVTDPRQLSPRADDVIFLVVKSQQTAASVQALHEVFDQETPLFCFQNGIRNEKVAAWRFRRVYGVMLGPSATLLGPGVIAHTRMRNLAIGDYPLGCDELALAVAEQLTRAGFEVTTHYNVMAVKWSKLLLNLNNATHAIANYYVQLSQVTPKVSHFMADVVDEGLRVLAAAGISIEEKNNPLDVRAFVAKLRGVGGNEAEIRAAESLPDEMRTWPSTWVDLKNKRDETEVEYFNGEIVLLGEKHHIPTPFNTTLLNTVEIMAAGQQPPGRYTIDELIGMVEQKRSEMYQEHSKTPPQ